MGFKTKVDSQKENFGLEFTIGEPTTVKADMKDGFFKHLSSEIGVKQMKIALLKDVSLKELVLYPHDEKDTKEKNWRQIFYVDLETNEVCASLIKTYNLAEFDMLERQLKAVARNEGKDIDYTDVEINATIEQHSFSGEKRFIVRFYFCKDKKTGDPCLYLNDDGSVNQNAEVQFLEIENFKTHQKFFKKHQENLFDYRLSEEIVKRNFKGAANLDSIALKQFRIYTMYKMGYFSEEKARELCQAREVNTEEMNLLLSNG